MMKKKGENMLEKNMEDIGRKPCPKYTVLKVLSVIFYVALLAMLLIQFVPILNNQSEGAQTVGIIFFLLFILIIYGGIMTVISTIISGIGLILTIKNKNKGEKKGQLIFFIMMTVLPLITELIFYMLCMVIVK